MCVKFALKDNTKDPKRERGNFNSKAVNEKEQCIEKGNLSECSGGGGGFRMGVIISACALVGRNLHISPIKTLINEWKWPDCRPSTLRLPGGSSYRLRK